MCIQHIELHTCLWSKLGYGKLYPIYSNWMHDERDRLSLGKKKILLLSSGSMMIVLQLFMQRKGRYIGLTWTPGSHSASFVQILVVNSSIVSLSTPLLKGIVTTKLSDVCSKKSSPFICFCFFNLTKVCYLTIKSHLTWVWAVLISFYQEICLSHTGYFLELFRLDSLSDVGRNTRTWRRYSKINYNVC